ncbi:helix-turn-helix domain-containing protein [Actinokineospora sp.]|uniref:helix-turn-helix domain-containing protein n=1 Tax=Actinokineospora sp. TaxID=1872133 RepID=UPI004037A2DF
MSSLNSPMVRRLRLGGELKALRLKRALTLADVTKEMGWGAQSKLSRLENGKIRPDLADMFDLLDLYEVADAKREKLISIARDAANSHGWWRTFRDMGDRQRSYAEIESGAAEIRQYQQNLVPGLLQTQEYARLRALSGKNLYEELDLDGEATARQIRQSVLVQDKPPRFEAVLDEAALRRNAGSAAVLASQFERLLELAERPNIELRVLALSARIADYYVPHTTFTMYKFRDPDDPPLVAVETLGKDVHLIDPEDIARYTMSYDWLRAAALPAEDSLAFIADLAGRT